MGIEYDESEDSEGQDAIEQNKEAVARSHRYFKPKSLGVINGLEKKLFRATKASWISNLVYLDGKRFSFKDREYLLPIYNGNYKRKLLLYARQSEKSTALANELIVNSVVKPYNKAVYVSPSYLQSRQFSSGKLGPWMADSPVIDKYYRTSQSLDQVFEKGLANGSMIWIRSAFLNAERIRGLSADELMLDECQSLISSNIPVIMEVLSHSPDPHVIFAGTPLTLDNYIHQLWEQSSMCEWLVPCDRHTPTHWNYLDEKCIGKTGPICNRCGHPVHPPLGKWVSFAAGRDLTGFHISQLQVPWMQSPEKWKEILWKFENYSKGQFYQECLGISFDSASKPVTRTELIACCSSYHPFRAAPDTYTNNLTVFAGIDWGEGSDGSERGMKGKLKNASYTVVSLGAYLSPHQFHVFFVKRYEGEEALPHNCVKDIVKICRAFNVTCLGVDWGHGWGVNDQLEQVFTMKRVIKFQYVGMQKERKKFDPIGLKIQLNRTEVMTDFFQHLKSQRFVFPPWEVMNIFLKDVEHIHAEYGSTGMLKYDHRASEPDDAAHSLILCKEAADHYYGKA